MQQVRIDFDNPGLPQSLGVVEGESQSRIFQAALYKSGAAYTAPAGAVYSIMYRGFGPQNQGWYDTIEDGAGKRAACTVSGNVVTCELARQALRVPGHLTVVLCVSDAKGYMLKSWPIMADVRNDGYEDTGEIEMYFNLSGLAGNYLTRLEKAMADAEATKNNLISTSARVQKDIDAKAASALESIPEEYTELDGSVKKLKEELTDVKNALVFVESSNHWNPDEVTTVTLQGTSLLQSGKVSVSEGETYYLSQHANNRDSLVAEPFWGVYQYGSDGNKTMSKNWLSSYTVPSGVVAVQFLNASTTYKYIMVEKNTQTLKWEDYFDPYYKCVDTEARTDIDEMKKATEGLTDNSEFVIPSAFYGVVNHETNIYYQNICKNVSIDSVCGFDTTSVSSVERYRDRLIWKPTEKSIENGKISFYKSDWNHETKNTTVPFISAPSDTGSTEIKVIVIGDSKIAYGEVVRYLSSLFDSDNHTLTLLGSRYDNNDTGDTKYKHEGRNGWSSYHYTYVQSHNGVTNAFYNSSYTDPSYGTKFDFSTYMRNQGYDGVDYVFINLGTNDFGQNLTDTKWQTDAMIKSIHAFNPSIKIVIGLNEGVYRRALQHTALNEWIYTLNATKIAKYDGKLPNVYVLPIYPSIDLYNDYPMTSVALSEGDSVFGDSKTRTYVSDPIHQNKAGFYKYAMCMYSLIKCIEGRLVN